MPPKKSIQASLAADFSSEAEFEQFHYYAAKKPSDIKRYWKNKDSQMFSFLY
jgi:hypothetical protein